MKHTLDELDTQIADLSARLDQAEEEVRKVKRLYRDLQATASRLRTMIKVRLAPEAEEAA